MEVLAQSSLLVAFTSFAFGLAPLAKNVRNKLYRLFAVGCLLVSGWALFFFLSRVRPEGGYYGWHLFLNAWITPVALMFIQSMTRIDRRWVSRALFWGSIVLCVVMSIALLFGYERIVAIRSIIYYTPSLILIQTLYLLKIDRQINPVVGIEKRVFLYFGVMLVLLTCVMDHVPGLWVGIPIFGNLALTVLLYFISQAITQQRLLNLGSLLSRFLTLIFVAFLLSAIYSLLAVWVREFGLYFLNSFIVSFVLLTLLEPTRSLVSYLTGRLMTQKHRRLQSEMIEIERRIAQIVDPMKVLDTLEEFLVRLLKPRKVAFYLQSSTSSAFRKMRETGESTLPGDLPRQHSLLDALERVGVAEKNKRATLLLENLESESERLAGRERKAAYETWLQSMKTLGINIVIPLHSRGRLLGFIALDVESPPEEWGESWSILKEIEPLIDVATVALSKMEVFFQEREIERLATLGEMAAGLAHEIRNPLGAIKGAAQYLDPSLDRPESRFLRVIIEEVDRLNRVVTQFLDYSKPHPPLRISEVDLNSLAQKTVTLLSRQAPAKVDLRFQSSLLQPRVRADAELVHQVLMNLVQNSFNALAKDPRPSAKEVLISVDALPLTESGESTGLVMSVEDRGPGIPRENLDKVFIPFFTTNPSGTGLGLSICQRILQAHGGRIEVESQPGIRTVFRVILPEGNRGER